MESDGKWNPRRDNGNQRRDPVTLEVWGYSSQIKLSDYSWKSYLRTLLPSMASVRCHDDEARERAPEP